MKTEKTMTKRKWHWYNKLSLLIKEKLTENIEYSTELKSRLQFSRFLYSQRLVLLLLLLPIIVLSFIFFYLYLKPSENILFEINLFDSVAVIATYFGTTFLALIVWHNTWLQKREKENESAIRIQSEFELNEDTGYFLHKDVDITQIKIKITNQNNLVPITVNFAKIFERDNTTVLPTKNYSVTYEGNGNSLLFCNLLSFNETEKFTINLKNETFSIPKQMYIVFHISNAYDHSVYCIVDCNIDKSGWIVDPFKKATLIDSVKFKELKEKYGYYFLKEVVWCSPVGWNKKYINRIHLFKVTTKKVNNNKVYKKAQSSSTTKK